tara:strand:- start:3700 stop:4398 length:699 start_codon:yes stop_codon:yes gene_type:complete
MKRHVLLYPLIPNSQASFLSRLYVDDGYVLPRRGSVKDPIRIAVLISGGGSGLLSLLNYQQSNPSNHSTKLVIADNVNAGGLRHGENFNVPVTAIPLPVLIDKTQQRMVHEDHIHEMLINYDIELVVLSGYMRILTPNFVRKWKGRLINIHPSLLPNYPGAHAHRDALADGAEKTGCTIHLVDEGVDSGKIIFQQEVPILAGDTIEKLQDRVKKVEHQVYPKVLDEFCSQES